RPRDPRTAVMDGAGEDRAVHRLDGFWAVGDRGPGAGGGPLGRPGGFDDVAVGNHRPFRLFPRGRREKNAGRDRRMKTTGETILPHAKGATAAKKFDLFKTLRSPRPSREEKEKKNSLFRQWHGPLTEQLVQHPGDFGLGRL